jgi:hypothetical protein
MPPVADAPKWRHYEEHEQNKYSHAHRLVHSSEAEVASHTLHQQYISGGERRTSPDALQSIPSRRGVALQYQELAKTFLDLCVEAVALGRCPPVLAGWEHFQPLIEQFAAITI